MSEAWSIVAMRRENVGLKGEKRAEARKLYRERQEIRKRRLHEST